MKADRGELPQGDDPRFESRVAFTGRADTNEKGQPRPEKGQPRPPPCPPPTTTTTTTTTTEPPCPLATTTQKPLTPCELARMRQNNYVMHDQPLADQPQADQPIEDRPQLRTVATEAPVVEDSQPSTASSMMNSRMPDYARNANWGGLRLYHTFQDPVYSNSGSTANNNPASTRNNINNDDEEYGFY